MPGSFCRCCLPPHCSLFIPFRFFMISFFPAFSHVGSRLRVRHRLRVDRFRHCHVELRQCLVELHLVRYHAKVDVSLSTAVLGSVVFLGICNTIFRCGRDMALISTGASCFFNIKHPLTIDKHQMRKRHHPQGEHPKKGEAPPKERRKKHHPKRGGRGKVLF